MIEPQRTQNNAKLKIKNAQREDEQPALAFSILHFASLIFHSLASSAVNL
jgi:hypothetical protein